jgi:histidinol-phosphate/aromatic aminotransferase/cobyric acid decarboxylase-like protein
MVPGVRELHPGPTSDGAKSIPVVPGPGDHGGDGARVAAALGLDPASVLDLSASLNPVAPDPAPVVARHLGELARYPDPAPATRALADAIGAPPERVLLTNGGAEAISLVAGILGGRVEEPEFSLHPRGGGPLWRSDPHNPTGRLAGPDERAGVRDEAFYPLAAGRWTRADPGTVVVGSLTKVFACPGLRVGYVLADPDLVARLRDRQAAWSVNGLAAAALPEMLATADLARWREEIAALRRDLTALLAQHGLDPAPSEASYVLCRKAPGLRERLAPQAVVVRDCASFGLPGHARIAVPNAAGLDRLAEALASSAS